MVSCSCEVLGGGVGCLLFVSGSVIRFVLVSVVGGLVLGIVLIVMFVFVVFRCFVVVVLLSVGIRGMVVLVGDLDEY